MADDPDDYDIEQVTVTLSDETGPDGSAEPGTLPPRATAPPPPPPPPAAPPPPPAAAAAASHRRQRRAAAAASATTTASAANPTDSVCGDDDFDPFNSDLLA